MTSSLIARKLMVLLVVCVAMAATGCAHRTKQPTRVVRVAVVDGPIEDPGRQGRVERTGWWFGSRERYRPGSMGHFTAQAVSDELAGVPGVDVYSREDIGVFMAQKQRLLRRAYPQLDVHARTEILVQQDPLDYGRALNVDYVVRPVINEFTMVNSRVFTWWSCYLDATVEVWDVDRGELVAAYRSGKRGYFVSPLTMGERFARRSARRASSQDWFSTTGR